MDEHVIRFKFALLASIFATWIYVHSQYRLDKTSPVIKFDRITSDIRQADSLTSNTTLKER
jgi:hypothetical protein